MFRIVPPIWVPTFGETEFTSTGRGVETGVPMGVPEGVEVGLGLETGVGEGEPGEGVGDGVPSPSEVKVPWVVRESARRLQAPTKIKITNNVRFIRFRSENAKDSYTVTDRRVTSHIQI